MGESYQSEQEALEAEVNGDLKTLDLHIPKEPEVDPRVYRDVLALLYRGFIHISAEINGVPFVLKSLNQHEFDLLQMTMGAQRSPTDTGQRFYNLFLAYGVFMVDGINILSDRDRWIPTIADQFGNLRPPVRNKLIWNMSELNRRASAAVTLTEAYAMEHGSRFRWSQMRGLDQASTSLTGIRGTEYLGLNWAQLTWRALNTFEDTKEVIEREWENAKFVGSCFAGKGISKVYNQDNKRRQDEAEARVSRKDSLLRHVLLGTPMAEAETKGGQVVYVAKTVDQLADQLSKSLRGERDWHDEVVHAIEERQQSEHQAQQDRLQQLAEENDARFGPQSVFGTADLTGLSLEDVAKRLEARQRASASQVLPEDPRQADFLDKWSQAGKEPPMAEAPPRDLARPFRR